MSFPDCFNGLSLNLIDDGPVAPPAPPNEGGHLFAFRPRPIGPRTPPEFATTPRPPVVQLFSDKSFNIRTPIAEANAKTGELLKFLLGVFGDTAEGVAMATNLHHNFEKEDVDLEVLKLMNESHLQEFNLKLGQRLKLWQAVCSLRAPKAPATAVATANAENPACHLYSIEECQEERKKGHNHGHARTNKKSFAAQRGNNGSGKANSNATNGDGKGNSKGNGNGNGNGFGSMNAALPSWNDHEDCWMWQNEGFCYFGSACKFLHRQATKNQGQGEEQKRVASGKQHVDVNGSEADEDASDEWTKMESEMRRVLDKYCRSKTSENPHLWMNASQFPHHFERENGIPLWRRMQDFGMEKVLDLIKAMPGAYFQKSEDFQVRIFYKGHEASKRRARYNRLCVGRHGLGNADGEESD